MTIRASSRLQAIAAEHFTDSQLLKASLIAGLGLFGIRRSPDPVIVKYAKKFGIDLSNVKKDPGGSGLIWEPSKIKRAKYSDLLLEALKDGDDHNNLVVDDFSYAFNPVTGKGQDISGRNYATAKTLDGIAYIMNVGELEVVTMDINEATKLVKEFRSNTKKSKDQYASLNTKLVSELKKVGIESSIMNPVEKDTGVLVHVGTGWPRVVISPNKVPTTRSFFEQKDFKLLTKAFVGKIWTAVERAGYPISKRAIHDKDGSPIRI